MFLEEDQADDRLGQQDEAREVSMPYRLVTQVRSDSLKRIHHQASHSDTCRDRLRAELEKSEEGREILPENRHVWMQGNKSNPLHQDTKRAVSEEWDRPPEKVLWRWVKDVH